MRTVFEDHHRFEMTYFSHIDGVYYTGDGKWSIVFVSGFIDWHKAREETKMVTFGLLDGLTMSSM